MSTKQQFFITLPSNVKSKNNSEPNTVTHYTTYLQQRLTFPSEEKWSVGLIEVTYPKTYYNLRKLTQYIDYYSDKGNSLWFFREDQNNIEKLKMIINRDEFFIDHTIDIQPGYFQSIEDLISILNKKMNFYDAPSYIVMPQLFFDKIRQKVYLTAGYQFALRSKKENENLEPRAESLTGVIADFMQEKLNINLEKFKHDLKQEMKQVEARKDTVEQESVNVVKYLEYKFYPSFGREIEQILGFIDENGVSFSEKISEPDRYPEIKSAYAKGYVIASNTADIKAGFSSIYIYSDIVQHSFVGDAYAQLLRSIPVKENAKWGESVHTVFNEPHLIPLQTRNFDTIEIDVRDDTGERIPFNSGKFIVKLLFKKDD